MTKQIMSAEIVPSQYIFDDGEMRSKLVLMDTNWYVGEWKNSNDDSAWEPWICGTREWLCLSEQDVKMAYPPKQKVKK